MSKKTVTLVINLLIAVMVGYAWLTMIFSRGTEALTAMGIWSLKYFTVLSNLLVGFASIVYAVCLIRNMRSGDKIPSWAHKLKFAGTVAVTVTMMTVLLFLGPTMGYAVMFVGPNLWLHLIVPVVAIAEFVFLDTEYELSLADTLFGVVPTLLYGIVYCANIYLNGVGSGPTTNDWYGFTMWGVELMPVVFAVMLFATWLFALAIRFAYEARRKAISGGSRKAR